MSEMTTELQKLRELAETRELVKTLFAARGENLSEADLKFAADLVDQFAEARASRAEQATQKVQDLLALALADHESESNGRIIAESALAAERGRVTKLENALTYLIEVRNIKCMHSHPGPDDICAKCIADQLLATEERTTP